MRFLLKRIFFIAVASSLIVGGLFIFPQYGKGYDDQTTHPALTDEIVDFYNLSFGNKLTDEEKEWIVEGSINEDTPPRWINHFYDPTTGEGWKSENLGDVPPITLQIFSKIFLNATTETVSSKNWVHNELLQAKYADYGGNRTWENAIRRYVNGDTEYAYRTLGDVLHLLEDKTVPDHTRNDTHAHEGSLVTGDGGSPYEDYSSNYTRGNLDIAPDLKKENKSPIILSSLDEYFDHLANYSNNNFFSEHTINSEKYRYPKILRESNGYAYGQDQHQNETILSEVRVETSSNLGITKIYTLKNDKVLSSYFSRLSREAVLSGAGVIILFHEEVAKAEKDKNLIKEEPTISWWQKMRSPGYGVIIPTINATVSGVVWAYDSAETTISNFYVAVTGRIYQAKDFISNTASTLGNALISAYDSAKTTISNIVKIDITRNAGDFATNQTASLLGAVAQNTKTNGADSRLRKNSQGQNSQGLTLMRHSPRSDLGNFYLGNLNPVLPPLATRTVQGESLDKTSVPRDIPRLVFVGGGMPMVAAPATSQVLAYVSEPSGETQEEAEPPSGGSAPTLLDTPVIAVAQCASSLATDGCLLATTTVHFEWTSVVGADYYSLSKNGTLATTTDTVLDIVARDFADYTLEVSAIGHGGAWQTSATSTQMVSVATIPIAINEIAWMGTVASEYDEWIELKNNTDHTIDLSQWVLESGDSTPYIALTGVITPREYLILERTDDTTTSVVAHAVYTGSLANTGEQLSLLYAATLFDQTPGGAWAAGYNSTTTRKTMERYSSREDGTDVDNWLTWGTNIDFIKNGYDSASSTLSGTPGARNSVSYLINKGQDITSNLTLTADEDYYIIATSTMVTASSTLTLEPGTAIEFYQADGEAGQASGAPYPELNILGVLDAAGTSENPIILESLLGDQKGRIRFIGGLGGAGQATGTSTLAYVWVESLNGIYLINDAHLEVDATQFLDNYRGLELQDGGATFVGGKIVRLGKGSTVSIENTDFASTTKEAIAAYYGSSVSIVSSTITDVFNADAIGIYNSTFTMASTTISRIDYGDGIGVYSGIVNVASSTISNILNGMGMYLDTSTSTIANTTIANSTDGGMYIYKGTATISSSTISNVTDGDGVDAYQVTVSIVSSTIRDILDGDGVYLSDANGTISNTTIENTTPNANDWGDGVRIYGGEASIESSSISGFTGGAGIEIYAPDAPVAISDTEIFNNGEGVSVDAPSSVIISPDVYIHDNPAS